MYWRAVDDIERRSLLSLGSVLTFPVETDDVLSVLRPFTVIDACCAETGDEDADAFAMLLFLCRFCG